MSREERLRLWRAKRVVDRMYGIDRKVFLAIRVEAMAQNSANPSSLMRILRIVSMTCAYGRASPLAPMSSMDIETGDHVAFDELALREVAGQLDPLWFGQLARYYEVDSEGELRALADRCKMDFDISDADVELGRDPEWRRVRAWNSTELVIHCREAWSDHVNERLAALAMDARIDRAPPSLRRAAQGTVPDQT